MMSFFSNSSAIDVSANDGDDNESNNDPSPSLASPAPPASSAPTFTTIHAPPPLKSLTRIEARIPGVGGGKNIRSHGGKTGGNKRHRRLLRDNILGITKPAIRRLARRGGVKRISGGVYECQRKWVKKYLEKIVGTAITLTEHARRKTVTLQDVLYALKSHNKTMFY